jgi:hypothetical protein
MNTLVVIAFGPHWGLRSRSQLKKIEKWFPENNLSYERDIVIKLDKY